MNNELRGIVNKYINDDCNPEQLERAIDIFTDPYHNLGIRPVLFTYWENIEKQNLNSFSCLSNPEMVLDNIHHRINLKKIKKRNSSTKNLGLNLLKIAAVLILGLFIVILIKSFEKQTQKNYSAHVPKGSITQMILPDSTVVYLNSGTEFRYLENNQNNIITGSKGRRDVFLTGEAWFDVSKNDKKQFVVNTPFHSIKVTGTRFNIKAYPEDQEAITTLEEGSIVLFSNNEKSPGEFGNLLPGQQLIFSKNAGRVIREVNPKKFSSWKENKLIISNMNLKKIFVLLERKYGVDIEIADNILLEYHYDTIITNESILDVLDLISETLPIIYIIEGQKIIIHKK